MGGFPGGGDRPVAPARLPAVVLILSLLGSGPLLAQPAGQPESAIFHLRIDEAVRSLEHDPRLNQMSHKQLRGAAEFTTGNVLYAVLHELGHALIDDMYLYVLGREEDAADAFPTVTALQMGGEFSQQVLAEATKGWFYADRRNRDRGGTLEYYDAHGLDQQRAFQIVCLMVGSDPDRFKTLADETKIPDDRQDTCMGDYNTASWGWNKALKPYRRGPGAAKADVRVSYGDAPEQDNLDRYAKVMRAVRLLEIVADYAADQFTWTAPLTLRAQTCGESDAHWNHPTRTLVVCYELAAEFCQLYRAYSEDWMTSARMSSKSPRTRRQ